MDPVEGESVLKSGLGLMATLCFSENMTRFDEGEVLRASPPRDEGVDASSARFVPRSGGREEEAAGASAGAAASTSMAAESNSALFVAATPP